MANNFWTEENKIMNYNNLIKIDMQHKLLKLVNQSMQGQDIPETCYNYDYFVGSKQQAIDFIADYADVFVESLRTYGEKTGRSFQALNPLQAVNLMALYRSREIVRNCNTVKENWNQEFVLKSDAVSQLIYEIDETIDKSNMFLDKMTLSDKSLQRLCADYLRKEMWRLNGLELQSGLQRLPKPVVDEVMAKSILKNNYFDVVKHIENASLDSLIAFAGDILLEEAKELVSKELSRVHDSSVVNKEMLRAVNDALSIKYFHEVEMRPQLQAKEQKEQIRPEPIRETIKNDAREK